MKDTTTADAINHTLRSCSVRNNNGETGANVVDVVSDLADAAHRIATAITYGDGGRDANNRYVGSLTEAVMGMTAGLFKIATAIEYLAEAKEHEVEVREREFERSDTPDPG